MKRILLSLITSIIIYLLISFIMWDITIVSKLPNSDYFARVIIVFIFIAKEAFISIEPERGYKFFGLDKIKS